MSASPITSVSDARTLVHQLKSDPDSVELHQRARAVCTSDSWPQLCEAEYPNFLVEYVQSYQDDEIRSNGLPAWCLSAWEISIALQASNTSSASFAKSALNIKALNMLREITSDRLIPAMVKKGETGRAKFGDPEAKPDAASCISAASGLCFALCHSLKVHPDATYLAKIRSIGAIELCTLCWYWTNEIATRITCSICLESLLEGNIPDKSPWLTKCVDVVEAREIVKKCKAMLQQSLQPGLMTDGHRLVELCLVQWLSDESFKNELGHLFIEEKVQDEIMAVVMSLFVDKDAMRNWDMVDMCGAGLLSLSNAATLPVVALMDYVQRLNLLAVLCTIFLDNSLEEGAAQAWINILDLLVHCTACTASECHYVRSDAYVNAIRSSLEHEQLWTENLVKLEARSGPPKMAMRLWFKLGREVGMVHRPPIPVDSSRSSGGTEDKGKISREDLAGCWWTGCEWHGSHEDGLEKRLSQCSLCHLAKYCSVNCQHSLKPRDWTGGHKAECKRLRTGILS